MAPHSSTLAWKIPWTEEPGRLQSMGSQRVGHNWATSLSLFTFMHWRRKWQPTPVFLPGESQGQGSLVPSMGSHRVGYNWSDLAAAAGESILGLEEKWVEEPASMWGRGWVGLERERERKPMHTGERGSEREKAHARGRERESVMTPPFIYFFLPLGLPYANWA